MASLSFNSSDDDEDDGYCNAAARLQAIKTMRKKNLPPIPQQQKFEVIQVIPEPKSRESEIDDNLINSQLHSDNQSSDDNAESLSDSNSSSVEEQPLDRISLNEEPIIILDSPINISDSPSPEDIELANKSIEDLDDSINVEPTVDIHVKWKLNKIECLHLNKTEPLMKIFRHFADQEDIPVDRVCFYKGDIPIKTSDTPLSLKLSIIDVLEGGILNSGTSKIDSHSAEERIDENTCRIKAQISSKKSLIFRLGRNEPFKKLIEYCSTELGVSFNQIKVVFDGEQINKTDTPDNLDLDDEACVDVKITE